MKEYKSWYIKMSIVYLLNYKQLNHLIQINA